MIIFKIIFTNVFRSSGMCEWMSRRVFDEGSWLYSLWNVSCKKEKEKKKKAKLPFTPQCSLLSCTVQHCMTAFCRAAQRSLMLSVFQHHLTVSPTESIVYWTQAYVLLPFLKGRNPKLWPTQKHTVTEEEWPRSAIARSFAFELTQPWTFFFLNTRQKTPASVPSQKDVSTSMSKKSLQEFNVTMSVCIILYALVLLISVYYVKTYAGRGAWVHERLEFQFYKQFAEGSHWLFSPSRLAWLC